MAKKEKIVDLKSKPEKITDEQLKRVQDIISGINQTQLEIGNLETRKHSMLHNVAMLNDRLTVLKDEFQKDYNTTDINIQTGEIKYPENGETDKKD